MGGLQPIENTDVQMYDTSCYAQKGTGICNYSRSQHLARPQHAWMHRLTSGNLDSKERKQFGTGQE